MKMKLPKRWYVVADAGRATAYACIVPGANYRQATSWTSALDLPSDEQPDATDKPGRVFDSIGQHRHATETVPPKELLKQAFGRDVAKALNKARSDGAFESLVLYAAPRFLHELREHLDKPTADAIVHSEAKDLTRLPEQELFAVFDSVPGMTGTEPAHHVRIVGER